MVFRAEIRAPHLSVVIKVGWPRPFLMYTYRSHSSIKPYDSMSSTLRKAYPMMKAVLRAIVPII